MRKLLELLGTGLLLIGGSSLVHYFTDWFGKWAVLDRLPFLDGYELYASGVVAVLGFALLCAPATRFPTAAHAPRPVTPPVPAGTPPVAPNSARTAVRRGRSTAPAGRAGPARARAPARAASVLVQTSTRQREEHLADGLGERRVRVDVLGDVGRVGLPADDELTLGDHLRDVRAHQVHPAPPAGRPHGGPRPGPPGSAPATGPPTPRSATTFTRPLCPCTRPLAVTVSGSVLVTTSWPRSRAPSSVSPTDAVCGLEYVTRGTAV